MPKSELSADDYTRLAKVMAGPHGSIVDSAHPADVLIVFACADPEVGRAAAALHRDGYCQSVIISGALGKDSGDLGAQGITEARYLASVAIDAGLPAHVLNIEERARNGRENALYSLQLAAANELIRPGSHIASLAPVQRSRRLFEELRFQAKEYPAVAHISGLSSGHVDESDPAIQAELVAELKGLSTMHALATPRIYPQPDFLVGGVHFDLVERVVSS